MIYLVYGPAMSGKTTYCKANMAKHDKLFDYDDEMKRLSNKRYQEHDTKYHNEILSIRKQMIYEYDNTYDLYVISTYYSNAIKKELQGKEHKAIRIDTDYMTCIRRLNESDRPDSATIRMRIIEWFDDHYYLYRDMKDTFNDETKKLKFYKSTEWKQGTRERILNRDNRECQICKFEGRFTLDSIKVAGKKKTPRLNAHHIMELEDFPELAHEDDNIITVCISCHNRIHNKRDNKFFKFKYKPNKWASDEFW